MSSQKLPGLRILFPDMFPSASTMHGRGGSPDDLSSSSPESPPRSIDSSPVLDASRLIKRRTHSSEPNCGEPGSFFAYPPQNGPPRVTSVLDDTVANSKKRYRCSVCYRRFERPSSLETHMNSHTGARPHVCPQPGCPKSFTTRSNMQRHFRSHDGKLPLWPPA